MLYVALIVACIIFKPLIALAESPFPSAKSLTADEVIWLEQELENCCKIEQWSLRDGPIDLLSWTYKLATPDGSHLFFIEEMPGAHTQWFKVLHLPREGVIKELSFPEPVYLGDPEKLVGIGNRTSAYNPSYDPDAGTLTTWDFARAGDLSWKTHYRFLGNESQEFVLVRYQSDTKSDGQIMYDLDIKYTND